MEELQLINKIISYNKEYYDNLTDIEKIEFVSYAKDLFSLTRMQQVVENRNVNS